MAKGNVGLEVKKNEYQESIEGIVDKVIALMNEYNENIAKQMFQDDIMRIISNLQKAVENESIKRVDIDKAISEISKNIGEQVSKKIKKSKDESSKSERSSAIIRLIENIISKIMNYKASRADTKHNKDLHTSFAKEELTRAYIISSHKDDTEKQLMPYFINALKSIVQKRRLVTGVELQRITSEISNVKLQEVEEAIIAPLKENLSNVRAQFSDLQEKSIKDVNVILELEKDNEALKKQVTELTNDNDGLKQDSDTLQRLINIQSSGVEKELLDIQSRTQSLESSSIFNTRQTSREQESSKRSVDNVVSVQSLMHSESNRKDVSKNHSR